VAVAYPCLARVRPESDAPQPMSDCRSASEPLADLFVRGRLHPGELSPPAGYAAVVNLRRWAGNDR